MVNFNFGRVFLLFALISFDFVTCAENDTSVDWDYSDGAYGPSEWSSYYSTCGESEQSPIDIPQSSLFEENLNQSIPIFNFQYGDITYLLVGERLTVKVEVLGDDSVLSLGNGEGLPYVNGRSDTIDGNQFILEQFHLHWGEDDTKGSEHSFDSEFFAMELHLVHWNSGLYSSFDEAAGSSDGLMVIAVMFDVSDDANMTVDEELSALYSEVNTSSFREDDHVALQGFDLQNLLSSLDTTAYYTYPGSLTTPPCSETVTWVLLKQPLYVSAEVTAIFRQYEEIEHNYRPSQLLNGRRVLDSTTQTATTVSVAASSSSSKDDTKVKVAWITPIAIVAVLAVILVVVTKLI